jgi:hypothetical protein
MVDHINLYISAAQDVWIEREILAKLTIEIPVTLGWNITQSPLRGEGLDKQSVLKSDFHILILGTDIRAPIGVEWLISNQAGNEIVLLKKSGVIRTPAAEQFIRTLESSDKWIPYKTSKELRLLVFGLLCDHIVENAIYYSLQPAEYIKLLEWRKELDQGIEESDEEIHRGAGESSIILSRERYLPTEGILLEEDRDPRKQAINIEKTP